MQKLAIAFDDPVAQPAVTHPGGTRVSDVLAARYAALLNRPPVARSQVGVELEFPLCTRSGQPLAARDDVVARIGAAMGLAVVGRSDTGEVMTVRSSDGAVTIGYEYARAVLELALAPARDCLALADRLGTVLKRLDAVLADLDLYLGDTGLHPQAWSRTATPLPTPHYRAVDRFLKSAPRGGDYHRFTGFIASCQTHVDACATTAPLLSETFRRAGFVSALLLANSAGTWGTETHLISRDHLWRSSAFGGLGSYAPQGPVQDIDQFLRNEARHGLFLARRGQTVWSFDPVPLHHLDTYPHVTAHSDLGGVPIITQLRLTPEDARHYRAYGHAVPTAYGTIELRGDCLQPRDAILAPAALALGLGAMAQAVTRYLADVTGNADPMQLRAAAARHGWAMPTEPLQRPLDEICQTTLAFARQGLQSRGFGEAVLLEPLFQRAAQRTNPAAEQLQAQGA